MYKWKKLSKNKMLEIEANILKNKPESFFSFKTTWTIRGDHAGFKVNLEIFKFYFNFEIYDQRHWDYETDTFEKIKNK